jgi:hypothetical protein
MGRQIRGGVLFVLLCGAIAPALAVDPVLMFLLSMAREAVAASLRKSPPAPALPEPSAQTYPGTLVEPEHVRRLIDEGFGYLSSAQREEIFHSLHAALADPKNAALRGPMIEHFAVRAAAMREARERLARMSPREKALLASDFRKSLATLPPEEAQRLLELLRQGLLPVPSDLGEMLLGAAES